MRYSVYLTIAIFALAAESASSYKITLNTTYQGSNFFPAFDFISGNPPGGGYVNYLNQTAGSAAGLISINADGSVYIGVDTKKTAVGTGRNSIRLESKTAFNSGTLIIADIAHLPTACGIWPAFWMFGAPWPNGGEVDIIEYVNTVNQSYTTVHTTDNCTVNPTTLTPKITGTWQLEATGQPMSNCYIYTPGHPEGDGGCGVYGNNVSAGAGFNSGKGGVYATLWTDNEIAVYFFSRNAIPTDIKNKKPDPSKWGKPVGLFPIGAGSTCSSDHFWNMKIIININFCGGWTNGWFSNNCPNQGDCVTYVQQNPSGFKDAYWIFNHIEIYNVA